jgi:hypothetical protein
VHTVQSIVRGGHQSLSIPLSVRKQKKSRASSFFFGMCVRVIRPDHVKFRGCLVPKLKNFGVSQRIFHGMSEGMFEH